MEDIQNILDALREGVTYRPLARRIAGLKYPFLHTLPLDEAAWLLETEAINSIGHACFSPPDRPTPPSMAQLKTLQAWVKRSPTSWLVQRVDGVVQGYVHAEPLRHGAAQRIIDGQSHEGLITPDDILDDDEVRAEDYLHVGSVVGIRRTGEAFQVDAVLYLIAGLVDRLLTLRAHSPALRQVLAVDYADSRGTHHFTEVFDDFGFTAPGVDREGDAVRVLDLNEFEHRCLDWLIPVAERRARYLIRLRRLRLLALLLVPVAQILGVAGYPELANKLDEGRKLLAEHTGESG